MPKPMRNAGVTKERLLAEIQVSGDPKLIALIPKLRAVKGWTADDLYSVLCEMNGETPEERLKNLKK